MVPAADVAVVTVMHCNGDTLQPLRFYPARPPALLQSLLKCSRLPDHSSNPPPSLSPSALPPFELPGDVGPTVMALLLSFFFSSAVRSRSPTGPQSADARLQFMRVELQEQGNSCCFRQRWKRMDVTPGGQRERHRNKAS